MALEVIGAGYGRTGTTSLCTALIKLGFPCYHMKDVLFDPKRKTDVDFWLEVAEDPDTPDRDWSRVFSTLRAALDFPASAAWRALVAAYPEAKVILTRHPRGAEAWYDSTRTAIYFSTHLDAGSVFGEKINAMLNRLVWHGLLQDTMDDRDRAIARYNAHIEEVRDTVPADRLLDYSVDQGWDPLCAFLGVPVPEEDFPRANDREEMAKLNARLMRMRQLAAAQTQR